MLPKPLAEKPSQRLTLAAEEEQAMTTYELAAVIAKAIAPALQEIAKAAIAVLTRRRRR